ncbi:hypothetical protein ABZ729_16325 [Streptomyces sp. NPDC006678]|uniref:hypothetical protein n=1 Tax=unclassified Streptomyces TaxID=2593676 RepID=UPI0033A5F6EA
MEHDQGAGPITSSTDDALFGDVHVSLDTREGVVTVDGEGIPSIVIRRADGTEADDHTPVGTRDGSLLSLEIAGRATPLRPAKGRLTRKSFRVDVIRDDTTYRLVPDSIPGSRLLRDGQHIGDFASDGDGIVLAEWKEGAEVRPVEAAVGYALAVAFGTGAQPMWMLVLDALGDLLPG